MLVSPRWVLIGGSGFLGTNFLRNSRPEDGEIVVISRHAARWPVIQPWIRVVEADAREIEAYRHELTAGSIVVNLASSSYPGKAEKMIESDIQDNVLGTLRLAQACADQAVGLFIFLSSGGAVYGEQPMSPISEDANPRPISAYGAMKLTIEHYLYIIHHLKGLPVVCLRAANCFGSWHSGMGQGAINVFLHKMKLDQPIVVWGDGKQVRDYIAAEDVCDAIRGLGLAPSCGFETFNVGTGVGRSLMQVLSSLELATGLTPRVSYLPARTVDVYSNILDSTKLRERCGWEAKRPFDEALASVWEWMRTHA